MRREALTTYVGYKRRPGCGIVGKTKYAEIRLPTNGKFQIFCTKINKKMMMNCVIPARNAHITAAEIDRRYSTRIPVYIVMSSKPQLSTYNKTTPGCHFTR